jgi:molybdenum cofactor cytidylyltransferase
MKTEACAIVILAAGASKRLGQPKQFLEFQKQSLVKRLVIEAKKNTETVVVVTGYGHDQMVKELNGEDVHIIENKDWAQGMGSSIKEGMRYLKSLERNVAAVILAVCDQPFVTATLFAAMIDLHKHSGKKIVACSYADSVGTPVLFERTYFEALQQLSGSEGAKKIVQQYADDVALIPFPLGVIDIDTQGDYEALLQQK